MIVVGYAPQEPYVYIRRIGERGTIHRVWSRYICITEMRAGPQPGTGFYHQGEHWVNWVPFPELGTSNCPFTYRPTPERPFRRRLVWSQD